MVKFVEYGRTFGKSKQGAFWNLLLMAFLGTALLGSAKAAEKKVLHRPHHDPGTAQEAAGGFWRTDRDFDSSLRIKNILLKQPLDVTPVVYMADGTEVDLPVVHLPAAGVASINIGRMLQGQTLGAHLSSYGTASVRYKWSWAAVLGTIQNTDEMESITFHSTLNTNLTQLKDPSTASSTHILRGMWWAPHSAPSGFLSLSDVTNQPITAQVSLGNASGQTLSSKSVTVAPHGTNLLALQDLLGSGTDVDATGSVTITYTGAPGSLAASAGLENRAVGYSATPRLSEVIPSDDPSGPVELAAPGVMVGPPDPAMLFPAATVFTPYTYLQNLSSQPLQVTLSAANSGGSRVPLGTVSLPANGTTKVDVAGMVAKTGAQLGPETTNLLYDYTGRLGDLGVEAGSTDQTNNYVFEVGINAELPTISRTICYWTISGDNDSMIDLWNYTSQASDEVLTILFAGGQYKMPVHLAPGAGTTVSVHKLQHLQIPDIDGKIIPLNITEGSALLASAAGETEKMSVAVSAASFNVRNATCGYECTSCNGVTEFSLNPDPLPLPFQQNGQMSATATYNTGSTQITTSGSWSSQSTSTASVDSNGLVGGVNPGQSEITLISSGLPPDAGTVCSNYNPQCPGPANFGGEAPAQVKPTVTISGPTAVPISGSGATNTATEVAAGSPGGGTYSWSSSGTGFTLSSTTSDTTMVSGVAKGTTTLTVTYTLNGESNSATQTVYIQVPSRLSAPSFQPVTPVTNGNVVDYFGNVVRTGYCGVYQNNASDLYDQMGAKMNTTANFTLTESFSGYTSTFGGTNLPTQSSQQNTSTQRLADTQGIGGSYPNNCLGANDNEAFDQHFSVSVGQNNYPLTTVRHISRGSFNGTRNVTVTTTAQ